MRKINCMDIECAVANYFSYRVNLIVPNVSWGFGIHECDLFIVTPAGCAYEVEIKTSKADLKADLNKGHGHKSKRIKRLYFAIPVDLMDSRGLIPERAGILSIDNDHVCKLVRAPIDNSEARSLTANERFQIARLGTMRIWKLESAVNGLFVSIDHLKEKLENTKSDCPAGCYHNDGVCETGACTQCVRQPMAGRVDRYVAQDGAIDKRT